MKTCPICGLDPLPGEVESCPQCDADISCFRVLDSLPDERSQRGLPGWILVVVPVVLSLLILFQFYRLEGLKKELKESRDMLTESLVSMDSKITDIMREKARPQGIREEKGPAAPIVPENEPEKEGGGRFFFYNALDSDTLWDLARRFYGDGVYYPVILEHNPHVSIYRIGGGVRLKILVDRAYAKEVYRDVVLFEKGKKYWLYTSSGGESMLSVLRRYEKNVNQGDVPNLILSPGSKVKIALR